MLILGILAERTSAVSTENCIEGCDTVELVRQIIRNRYFSNAVMIDTEWKISFQQLVCFRMPMDVNVQVIIRVT